MFFSNVPNYNNSLPRIKSYIRLFHSSPNAPNIDIYNSHTLLASNLSFGSCTDYIEITPDEYEIKIYITDEPHIPICINCIDIPPNGCFTLATINMIENMSLKIVNDLNSYHNQNISFLRFIHYSPGAPLLNLSIKNDKTLFKFVEYKESTGYYPLTPGLYNFNIYSSHSSETSLSISNKLECNKSYTVYVIGVPLSNPNIKAIFFEDGIY